MKAPWVSVGAKVSISFLHKPPRLMRWGFHPSPLGSFFVGMDADDALCILSFAQGKSAAAHRAAWQQKWPRTEFVRDDAATENIMSRIFVRPARVHVALVGTDFQCAVWNVISSIPAGQTISYATLATLIKNPRAVRAVGTACGANPVPVLIPCHRVLASDGTLGGFGGGLPLKRAMLKEEGVNI